LEGGIYVRWSERQFSYRLCDSEGEFTEEVEWLKVEEKVDMVLPPCRVIIRVKEVQGRSGGKRRGEKEFRGRWDKVEREAFRKELGKVVRLGKSIYKRK